MKLNLDTKEHAEFTETLHQIAYNIDGGAVRSDYSGRSMYGSICYGIEGDNEAELLIEIGRKMGDLLDMAGLPKLDNMGLGIIAYWPNVAGVPDTSEDEAEIPA